MCRPPDGSTRDGHHPHFIIFRPYHKVLVPVHRWALARHHLSPLRFPPSDGERGPTLRPAQDLRRGGFRLVLPAFAKVPLDYRVWCVGPPQAGVSANITLLTSPNQPLLSDVTSRPGAWRVRQQPLSWWWSWPGTEPGSSERLAGRRLRRLARRKGIGGSRVDVLVRCRATMRQPTSGIRSCRQRRYITERRNRSMS